MDANQLVSVYIKIRDAKEIKKKQMEARPPAKTVAKPNMARSHEPSKHATGPVTGTVCTNSSVSMMPLTFLNVVLRKVTSRSSSKRIQTACLQV